MTNILAKIIYSLNSLICELLAAIMDWIFSLINEVGLDVSAITDLFKAKNIIFIQDSLKTIGTWLALLFFVWGIFQFLFPSSEVDLPADNPFLLVLRFAMSILFVNYFYNFYQDVVYDKLIVPIFDAFNNGLLVGKNSDALADNAEKAFGSMTSGFEFAELQQIVNLLLIIVFAGIFVVAAIKFVIYHFERLFEATILLYFSPVAASTYTLKPMSQIFKTYIKLLLQQGICLIMNIITTKLVMAGLVNLNGASASLWNAKEMVGEGAFGNEIKTYVIYMMLLTACLNVGKKASVYVAQLFGQSGMSDTIKNGFGTVGTTVATLAGATMGLSKLVQHIKSRGGKDSSGKDGSKKPADTDNLKANSNDVGSNNGDSKETSGGSKKPKSTEQANSNSSRKQSGNDKQQRKENGKQKAANTGNAIKNAQGEQTKNASGGDLSSTQGQKGATTDNGLNSQSKDSNSSQENRDSKQDLENEKNAKNGADTGNYRRDSANSSNYKQNSSGGGSSSPKSTSATQSSRSGNNGSGNSSGQKTSVSSSANYVDNRKAKSSGSNATSSKSQTVKQPNQSQRNKQSKN